MRVARLRCPRARVTISLLPDFLAARLSGTLAEVERAVEAAEAGSCEEVVSRIRPGDEERAVTLPSALRWLRRRVLPVRGALLALVTLLPELFGCAPTLAAVRERLGVSEALVALRARAADSLPVVAAPLGFRARARRATRAGLQPPHEVGPDPPGVPR
jgi:hypothetical protein